MLRGQHTKLCVIVQQQKFENFAGQTVPHFVSNFLETDIRHFLGQFAPIFSAIFFNHFPARLPSPNPRGGEACCTVNTCCLVYQLVTMGDVTEEELVQIATNFLLNAPPGEFMDVVTGMSYANLSSIPLRVA
jgi:hypothetical protein